MKSSFMRALPKYLAYLVIGLALIGAYASFSPEAFVRVPSSRDELVGDWYVERFGSFRKYSFFPNGEGEIISPGRPNRPFFWGTESGQLRMKYSTFNGWTAPKYKMSRSEDASVLELKEADSFSTMRLQRNPPSSAILQ
jgi:hypothetical protein